jgi:hypothetical protein
MNDTYRSGIPLAWLWTHGKWVSIVFCDFSFALKEWMTPAIWRIIIMMVLFSQRLLETGWKHLAEAQQFHKAQPSAYCQPWGNWGRINFLDWNALLQNCLCCNLKLSLAGLTGQVCHIRLPLFYYVNKSQIAAFFLLKTSQKLIFS